MAKARTVTRYLRFAWIEYEDHRDGVMFHIGFSSGAIGGRNLLLELPRKPPNHRVDPAHPDLDISWLQNPHTPTERGLIMRPLTDHQDFLGPWLLNPGVRRTSDTQAQLTFGNDFTRIVPPPGRIRVPSELQDQLQADIVAVSGHGGGGVIFGNAISRGNIFEVLTKVLQNVNIPTTGRVKYLILASCFNAGAALAKEWLPLFRKDNPFHGILGYSDHYIGNNIGALVMQRFTALLQDSAKKNDPSLTILNL